MKTLILCLTLITGQVFANDISEPDAYEPAPQFQRPTSAKELKSVTVKITNKKKSSGGSGVIYKSTERSSYILTNSHVCNVLEKGGLVITEQNEHNVEQYKQSKVHDICVVRVIGNLGVNTVMAASSPDFGDEAIISGHPFLLPTAITKGHISKHIDIKLLIGTEKCTEREQEDMGFLCFWFGGMPLIKTFTATTSTALISPGNSGSGVFNSEGEIIGLAFAGIGRGISQAFIVPLSHLKAFLRESKTLKWTEANSAVRYSKYVSGSSVISINSRSLKLTLKNLDDLYFPAIKDSKIQSLSEKLRLCKKGMGECQKYLRH